MQVGRSATYFNGGEKFPAVVVKDWGESGDEHLVNLLVLGENGNELKTSVGKWTPEKDESGTPCYQVF